eukprot:m.17734 g.17734  ORF g.17734 m.17734 type:complete len:661 (+) comp8349_c0_seq1:248-2230(+)
MAELKSSTEVTSFPVDITGETMTIAADNVIRTTKQDKDDDDDDDAASYDYSLEEEKAARRKKVTLESLKTADGWLNALTRLVYTIFPILTWAPNYKDNWKEKLAGDARAGLTVGILLIPQGLAYALLAELPVQYGLFSAFIPPLVYGFFGTSSELSVAPSAVISLLTASGVSALYDPDTETDQYVSTAISLALMLGLLQMLMGVFRLGFIINFLSHSVLSGFTSGSALIIGLSQFKHLFGVSIERSDLVHETLEYLFKELKNTNWRTFLVSISAMAIILFWRYPPKSEKFNWFRKYFKPLPSAMVVVVLFTIISYAADLEQHDVKLVGTVPAGLPSLNAPELSKLGDLIVLTVVIALVSYMESMAVAKKLADDRNYQLDYNQELIALGCCNILGSCLQAYPTTGGFARSAVNANAGSKTQLATIIAGFIVMIALIAATELFFFLPKAVLGSIIVLAIFPLINFREPFHLWKISKVESILTVLTFCLTCFVGVEIGVGISIVLALLVVVWQSSKPHSTLEGRLPGTNIYRNINRFPEAVEPAGMKIFRFDADLFFVNASVFERTIKKRCYVRGVNTLVLDFAPISRIDSTAFHALEKVLEGARLRKIKVYFAGVKGPVRDIFERVGFTEHVGEDHFFKTVHDAVVALSNDAYYTGEMLTVV